MGMTHSFTNWKSNGKSELAMTLSNGQAYMMPLLYMNANTKRVRT